MVADRRLHQVGDIACSSPTEHQHRACSSAIQKPPSEWKWPVRKTYSHTWSRAADAAVNNYYTPVITLSIQKTDQLTSTSLLYYDLDDDDDDNNNSHVSRHATNYADVYRVRAQTKNRSLIMTLRKNNNSDSLQRSNTAGHNH